MNALLALLLMLAQTQPHVSLPNFDRECLAMVGYTEARGEGIAGMVATMEVVLDRAHDREKRWPGTVCSVALQPNQFLGIAKWKPTTNARLPPERQSWESAYTIAGLALSGASLVPNDCRGAVFFDAGPRRRKNFACKIGAHSFYR